MSVHANCREILLKKTISLLMRILKLLLIAVTLFVCLQIFFKLLNRRSADSNAHLLPRWSSFSVNTLGGPSSLWL